jgi:sulfate transport system ATP-binding protein
MRFVGDAYDLEGALVRPHDLELSSAFDEDAVEAMIVRVTFLGRDVKVELHDRAGGEIVALLERSRYEELGLWRGQTVWARPQRERVFAVEPV